MRKLRPREVTSVPEVAATVRGGGLSQNRTYAIKSEAWPHIVWLCVAWIFFFLFSRVSQPLPDVSSDGRLRTVQPCLSFPTLVVALPAPLPHWPVWNPLRQNLAESFLYPPLFMELLSLSEMSGHIVWLENALQNLVYSADSKTSLIVRCTFILCSLEKEKFYQLNFDVILPYHLEFLFYCYWKKLIRQSLSFITRVPKKNKRNKLGKLVLKRVHIQSLTVLNNFRLGHWCLWFSM